MGRGRAECRGRHRSSGAGADAWGLVLGQCLSAIICENEIQQPKSFGKEML